MEFKSSDHLTTHSWPSHWGRLKSLRWPRSVWRSYEDSTCTEPKAVHGGSNGKSWLIAARRRKVEHE